MKHFPALPLICAVVCGCADFPGPGDGPDDEIAVGGDDSGPGPEGDDSAGEPPDQPSGLTWVVRGSLPALEVVHVGTDESSNAYYGDMPCTEQLPILCIDVSDLASDPGVNPNFYNGWSGGTVQLGPPVLGTELVSRAAADALCSEYAGLNYEMAEFHHLTDEGGWSWWAFADLEQITPEVGRFWVRIDDQPANCWDYL